jgi:hypothetical protein
VGIAVDAKAALKLLAHALVKDVANHVTNFPLAFVGSEVLTAVVMKSSVF